MVKYIHPDNPINELPSLFLHKITKAQSEDFQTNYKDAYSFLLDVYSQLRMQPSIPTRLKEEAAVAFADKSFGEFYNFFSSELERSNYPEQSINRASAALAARSMLLRAFADPDHAVGYVKNKVVSVINTFPRTAADIEVGRNKGDVLDPFILAATQYLLYSGEFDGAISATVSHKSLMIIEGLMGHLHEDVLGLMRGNVRVPEPRGKDQEAFSYETNPFPGADLIQPPARPGQKLRIHQIKSKTGSAKGGDGKRLGDQLRFLEQHYDAEIYYDALVGNTLIGHRSKRGVEKAAPNVRVLVGKAAFRQLTGSNHGASLLLRLYQEAFISAAKETGYSIFEITETIVEDFRRQSEEIGEGFLEVILEKSTGGGEADQDSRLFNRR